MVRKKWGRCGKKGAKARHAREAWPAILLGVGASITQAQSSGGAAREHVPVKQYMSLVDESDMKKSKRVPPIRDL